MNAVVSRAGVPQADPSQRDEPEAEHIGACDFRSGTHPPAGGADADDPFASLGRLLGGHTWRSSRDWARALDQLSQLSDDELQRVVDASPACKPT